MCHPKKDKLKAGGSPFFFYARGIVFAAEASPKALKDSLLQLVFRAINYAGDDFGERRR
jgi:hypothetical protein